FTTVNATDILLAHFRGEQVGQQIEEYNRRFTRSYARWFEALYLDKYDYMGDFELMRLGFLLDLGCYYLGVAAQPYKRGLDGLREPIFTTSPSVPVFRFMRFYNRRLAAMARARHARAAWGRKNQGRRFMFTGYTFSVTSAKHLGKALLHYAWLELREGWRSWWKPIPR